MKCRLWLFIGSLSFLAAAPMVMAQNHSDHVEVGAFAEYFRLSDAEPARNFIGLGGRAAFNGKTDFALYPGGGFEAFAGPIGIRAEVGDDIYFDHGAHNNLKVSFGPQLRF